MKCIYCKTYMSSLLETCPNCGIDVSSFGEGIENERNWFGSWTLGFGLLTALIWVMDGPSGIVICSLLATIMLLIETKLYEG